LHQVIWLAAHMDKDLKRQQIDSTSISDAVDTIILPPGASTSASQNNEAPLALRLSGQLLLGLVKIFDRKVTYLKHDCEEALQKMVPSTKEEIEGEDRGRHVAQQATHQTKRVRKAATSQLTSHDERNNNNGTDGALAQHFAVEEDEIFGGASNDSLKATAGASTSARLASTMLVAPHVPGSAAEIAGAPSRPSLNPGRALRDADDEMFEAAPEQFDFDLHESEVSYWGPCGVSSLASEPLLLPLPLRSRSLRDQKANCPFLKWMLATCTSPMLLTMTTTMTWGEPDMEEMTQTTRLIRMLTLMMAPAPLAALTRRWMATLLP
jgi:hypothetical protein